MSETTILLPDVDEPPPDTDSLYEVIDGQIVEPPEMAAIEILFANLISEAITLYFAQSGRLGWTVVEMLFKLEPESRRQRRPDLAYVSYERWPRARGYPHTASWQVVPDLAVEVISPSDPAGALLERIDEYFRARMRQVWVIYPKHGRVFVHTGPKTITVLDATNTLDGGDVLPGFRLKLADLFDEAAGTAP